MRFVQYILLIIPSILMTLLAYLLAPVLAICMDEWGNLPWQLSWFQPSDNKLYGDALWATEHPTWGAYRLAVTYQWRNPAQGFDQWIRANVTEKTPWHVYGNTMIQDGVHGLGGWYLITANGYFHFSFVIPLVVVPYCLTAGYGWRLNSLVKGYSHPTLGQYCFTLGARLQTFT